MGIFFKSFFASLLALLIFTIVAVFIFVGLIVGLASPQRVETAANSVLVLDLNQVFHEQVQHNPLDGLGSDNEYDVPGVYDVVCLLRHAKEDSSIKGIYIPAGDNSNGFCKLRRNPQCHSRF